MVTSTTTLPSLFHNTHSTERDEEIMLSLEVGLYMGFMLADRYKEKEETLMDRVPKKQSTMWVVL